MTTTARYYTTIAGQPVPLQGVTFITPEQADACDNLQASESIRRVMHNGTLAVGTVESVGGLFEADRCIAYSNTPSRHKCDARCMNAVGNQCECSCGGMNHGKGGFSALDWTALEEVLSEEDSDAADFGTVRAAKPAVALIEPAAQLGMGVDRSVATIAKYRCNNCGGSGRWKPTPWHARSWPCNKCHGKGLLKTDPAVLQKRREDKARKQMQAREEYRAAHADVFAWLDSQASKHSQFAESLLAAFLKWGTLTEGQIAAVRRSLVRDAEHAAKAKVVDAVVTGGGFDRMIDAFKAAKASGLKYPKFQVGSYVFQPATANSKYPNAIFVKGGRSFQSAYYGRIEANGDFFAARECTSEHRAAILEICKDPFAAAVMHGKQTGSCSCCGRTLENEESVRLGIGPICRGKWGLG